MVFDLYHITGRMSRSGRGVNHNRKPNKDTACYGFFVDDDDDLFEERHIKGAVHLPFEEDLPPEKKILKKIRESKLPIVVYDSGVVTAEDTTPDRGVANELNARGFSNVKVL